MGEQPAPCRAESTQLETWAFSLWRGRSGQRWRSPSPTFVQAPPPGTRKTANGVGAGPPSQGRHKMRRPRQMDQGGVGFRAVAHGWRSGVEGGCCCAGGAAALVLGGVADVEYVVLDPSVVYLLPKDVFDAVFRQVPEFALAVSKSIAGEAMRFTRHGAIPWVDLDAYSFDEHLWACLPASLTARACICPLDFSGDAMTVAMVDPREVAALDALSDAVPGVRFRVVACSAEDLGRFIGTRGHLRPGKAALSSPPSLGAHARAR